MIRTGAEYLERLRRRPPEAWIRGERVADVTAHPALAAPAAQIARLYDMQHDPDHAGALVRVVDGRAVDTAFVPPRTPDDLMRRGDAYRLWADATFGLMGRSPDFLNTTIMAFAESPGVFERMGPRFADNVRNYYRYVRDNDLFLTHALITPQTDRSRSAAGQEDEFLHMGVVEENADGLIVRGARMLATLGPLADELLVYSLPGLRPGDEQHAPAFAIPTDTPGLRLVCREPFDGGGRRSFDHPLASRFEEPDALVVFDDVLVPWDRVFLHGDVALANALYAETNVRQHTGHQTGVRGLVKLQFVVGIAMRLSQAVKIDTFLHVQQSLGECIAVVEQAKALLVAAETRHETAANGSIRPRFDCLQTLRMLLSRQYPKIVEVLQTLGAGGLLMMPSSEDFGSPIHKDIETYYQGADGLPAAERVALYKLAWDMCGDAFGQRSLQYERYYAGDPVRLFAANYLNYDKSDCFRLVDDALALAGEPDRPVAAATAHRS
jgi:anthranilate 3-monooxygenase (FAD) / 4-hydroxyphenylacetate 3-monooxygenase